MGVLVNLASLITLFFLLVPVAVSQKPVPVGKVACGTSIVKFDCPKNFELDKEKSNKEFLFLRHSDNKIALFVHIAPTARNNESAQAVLGKAVDSFFGLDLNTFDQKESDDFWSKEKFTETETGRLAKVGLNPTQQIAFHTHVVEFTKVDSNIVAGFIYLAGEGEKSRAWYANWRGGGNMVATYGLQALISSITGEKKKAYEGPGGPPPAVPARKAKEN